MFDAMKLNDILVAEVLFLVTRNKVCTHLSQTLVYCEKEFSHICNEVANILIKAGADLNAASDNGWTPLGAALSWVQNLFVVFILNLFVFTLEYRINGGTENNQGVENGSI